MDLVGGVIPFVQVAELASFRKAAERLGVTPAAISKAIARLEEELGARLFYRTSRRVSLTEDGQLYYERCREAVAQLTLGRESLARRERAPRGVLTLTTSPILGALVIPALARFSARHPNVSLKLTLSDHTSHMADEGIDVAIRIGGLEDSSLVAKKLFATRWVTVAAPAYLARRGTPKRVEDLANHACLRFLRPRGTEQGFEMLDDEGRARTVRVGGPLAVDQGEVLVAAAVMGMGLVQAPDFVVERHLADAVLVEVLRDRAPDGPAVHALTLPGRRPARATAFLRFLGEDLGRRRPAPRL
jgi:DNA-binding transcriptional LysR family regulator